MTYSIVVYAVIGTDCAENTIPLLFMGYCLVIAGSCDSTVLAFLAFCKYAAI
jgi:hypothetical protein